MLRDRRRIGRRSMARLLAVFVMLLAIVVSHAARRTDEALDQARGRPRRRPWGDAGSTAQQRPSDDAGVDGARPRRLSRPPKRFRAAPTPSGRSRGGAFQGLAARLRSHAAAARRAAATAEKAGPRSSAPPRPPGASPGAKVALKRDVPAGSGKKLAQPPEALRPGRTPAAWPAAWPATFYVVEGETRSVARFFFTYNKWPEAEFFAMDKRKHKLMARATPVGAPELGVVFAAPVPMEQFTDGHRFHWPDTRLTMTVAEHVDWQIRQSVHFGLGFHEEQSQALGHWLRHREDLASPVDEEDMGTMEELYLTERGRKSAHDPNCAMPPTVRMQPFHYYYRPLPSGDVVWYTSLHPYYHDICLILRMMP